MDAAQVQELMFAAVDEKYDYELDSWDAWEEMDGRDPIPVPNLGLVSIAESFGGEGQGDQYYLVFRVELAPVDENGFRDVKYFRVDGYYSSYAGGEYDGPLYEVQPVERLVTFYEKAE